MEYTKAKVVRGKNVVIGDGCEINLLEYESECVVHGHPFIKEKRKLSESAFHETYF